MASKKPRDTKEFATLDAFLDAEGTRAAFQAVAIKEVLAWPSGAGQTRGGQGRGPIAHFGLSLG
jgi:hypothetical protein